MKTPIRSHRSATVALCCALLSGAAACGGPAEETCAAPGGCGGSSGTSGGATTSSTSAPAERKCDADSVATVRVTPADPSGGLPYALGYPPYAVDDCRLAYVAPPQGAEPAGALFLRDLADGAEVLVADASERPRRPAIAGEVLAWEAEEAGKRVVRARAGGATVTLKGAFDHAGEPRVTADGVVFTGFLTPLDDGDTDVFFAGTGDAQAVAITVGPGQQRFADISATHIAYADFSEDPDGVFSENGTDLADIGLYDRDKKTSVVRHREGKEAFPILGAAGKVAYLHWGPDHPEPKFSAYQLFVGDVAVSAEPDAWVADITTSAPYVRPTARDARLEWVEWPNGGSASLWQRPADLSTAAEAVPGFSAQSLYGPAASSNLTVAAVLESGGFMSLRAIPR